MDILLNRMTNFMPKKPNKRRLIWPILCDVYLRTKSHRDDAVHGKPWKTLFDVNTF